MVAESFSTQRSHNSWPLSEASVRPQAATRNPHRNPIVLLRGAFSERREAQPVKAFWQHRTPGGGESELKAISLKFQLFNQPGCSYEYVGPYGAPSGPIGPSLLSALGSAYVRAQGGPGLFEIGAALFLIGATSAWGGPAGS